MTRLATHLVLSTAHLAQDVSTMLDEMGEDTSTPSTFEDWRRRVVRCGFGYGHWVKVPKPDATDPDDGMETRLADLPESLASCIRHAARFGAEWVLFDRDEEEIADLPRYEW